MRLLVISVLLLVMGVAPNVLAEGQIDSKDRLMELQDKRSVSDFTPRPRGGIRTMY
ncbi:MAG: hypothetical protein R3B12_05210 [Candidatus Saccharimonadales bacterium]